MRFLEDKERFIETELVQLLTHPVLGLGHVKYPVKSLKYRQMKLNENKVPTEYEYGTWYDVREKMQRRVKRFVVNVQSQSQQ